MKDVTYRLEDGPFTFPENLTDCVSSVFRGEYSLPDLPDMPPVATVLDLGANVGAFARWARQKWPLCRVTSFEPHPGAREYFVRNCLQYTELVPKALSASAPEPAILHEGTDWGMNSLFTDLDQRVQDGRALKVETMHPRDLPPCDVLKIDAEGVERDILEHYPHLQKVGILLFEWHREKDRRACEFMAERVGLRLFVAHQAMACQGVQRWVRSKAVFDHRKRAYVLP